MGRLRAAPPRLRMLAPRVASTKVASETRGPAEPSWRAWYKTREWQQLRWSVLVDALFTCALCNRVEPNSSKMVADHKQPHRGDATLFWARSNLQCLCKPCHDSQKQREEIAAQGRRGG